MSDVDVDVEDEDEEQFYIRRRHFVAIATWESEDKESFPSLDEKKVRAEVEEIRSWLVDKQLPGRRFAQERQKLAENPSAKKVEAAFRHDKTRVKWQENDAAVIYITGHGETLRSEPDSEGDVRERHYLVFSNTTKATLSSSGIKTEQLFEWLAEQAAEYLLVIVDACFAGSVTEQIRGMVKDRWLVLPSAASGQQAHVLALTEALRKLLANSKQLNLREPYFTVNFFADHLNSFLPVGQSIGVIYKGDKSEPHFCLPNPAYQPGDYVATDAARRELALPTSALELHNQPRGGPAPAGDRPGWWLFAGRRELMRSLIGAVQKPQVVTLVAGSAGCGKSTALSRLVTLTDPKFRARHADELRLVPADLLPPLEAVGVAVSASKRSNEALLGEICHRLKQPVKALKSASPVLDDYLKAMRKYVASRTEERQGTAFTIVIDALDEATEASKLVRDVLPLVVNGIPELCLIIGVRSPGGDGVINDAEPDKEPLADLVETTLGAQRIRVDNDPWWNSDDLGVFVRNILVNTVGSPYRDQPDTVVDGVSRTICAASGTSYLMAWVAANSVTKPGPVTAADDPQWLATLDGGLVGILRKDLRDITALPDEQRKGVALLRAVAFGRGNGIPWRAVWPDMANAVDDDPDYGRPSRSYGDESIEWLLRSRLNAYLVTDQQDELTVYRLLHEQLQKALQYHWRELLEEPATEAGEEISRSPESADAIKAVEERITRRLRSQVPDQVSGFNRPPSAYIRRYLAEHAIAADVLGGLPAPFLPYLDPAPLWAAIGASRHRQQLEEEAPWLPVIRRVTHLWNWDDPAANAAAIEMWRALSGSGGFGPTGGSWRVAWAVGPPDNGNILGRHDRQVRATATTELAGRPVAVTGGWDGTLRMWDLGRGMSYREPIQTGASGIHCVALARLPEGDSRPAATTVAVTGHGDGTVRVWELPSGRRLGGPMTGSHGQVNAVVTGTLADQRVLVAAADARGTIRTWDLATGKPVGRALITGVNLALGLAVAAVGRQALGLATGQDGGLQIWDLATGIPVADRLQPAGVSLPPTGTIPGGRAIAAATFGDQVIALTGYGDKLLTWDLRQREVSRRLTGNDGNVWSLAVTRRGDQVIAVTGGNKQATVWDITAGRTIGGPLSGHDSSVEAVAVIGSEEGALAVSADRDRIIRLWEITDDQSPRAKPSAVKFTAVSAVAAPPTGRLAIAGVGRVVQVRQLDHDTLVRSLTGHASTVVSLAAADLPDDDALVVAGGWDGTVHAWSVVDPANTWHTRYLHRGAISALALATLANGRIVAVTAGWDGQVRVWDPYASAEPCPPLGRHADRVLAVASAVSPDGRPLIVSGGHDRRVKVYDLDAHASSAIARSWPALDTDAGTRIASLAVTDHREGSFGIVVGGEDGTVRMLDGRDGHPLGEPWQAHQGAVTAVAVTRLTDGRVAVFTGGADSVVQAWDAGAGRAIAEPLPLPGPVQAMTRHLATRLLLIGGAAGAAVVQFEYNPRSESFS